MVGPKCGAASTDSWRGDRSIYVYCQKGIMGVLEDCRVLVGVGGNVRDWSWGSRKKVEQEVTAQLARSSTRLYPRELPRCHSN